MIGASLGSAPIGGSNAATVFSPPLAANIFLQGTFAFQSSFRLVNRVDTFLNFTLINSDDNVVKVNVINLLNSLPILLAGSSVEISVYAPGTMQDPIIVKSGLDVAILDSTFQFTLPFSQTEDLTPGHYPWIAVITLPDTTRHTVTSGNLTLTTGLINVVNRPPSGARS